MPQAQTKLPSRSPSRAASHDVDRNPPPSRLGLPTINEAATERRRHSSSVQKSRRLTGSNISLANYLVVNSPGNCRHEDRGERDEQPSSSARACDAREGNSGDGSPGMPALSTLLLSSASVVSAEETPVDRDGCAEQDLPIRFSLPRPLPTLDDVQRERLISREARSLGLASRNWPRSLHAERMGGEETKRGRDSPAGHSLRTKGGHVRGRKTETSRCSEAESKGRRRSKATGLHSDGNAEHHSNSCQVSRPQTSMTKSHRTPKHVCKKIERLKSIYKSSSSSSPQPAHEKKNERDSLQSARAHGPGKPAHWSSARAPSRIRGVSRFSSRPPTRQNTRQLSGCLSVGVSRAPTRMAIHDTPRELDGSACFNELPHAPAAALLDQQDNGRSCGERGTWHSRGVNVTLRKRPPNTKPSNECFSDV